MAEHATTRARAVTPLPTGNPPSRVLQRKCACASAGTECERCAQPLRLQRRSISTDRAPMGDAPSIVHDVLASPGRPLDAQTRSYMETRFGRSFADVRIHTDEQAAAAARAVTAHAYTVGNSVAFASHAFSPHSPAGQRLLAHELAHVVQQSSSGATPGLAHEQEADRAADDVLAGQNVRIGQTSGAAIQREEAPSAEAAPAEEPVRSFIGNRVVAFVTDMLPFGTTARIASGALSGLTTGAVKELRGGGKGAVLFRAIKGFRPENVPDVMIGYTAGAIQGVVSPVTDLFKLGQLVEHIVRIGANFLSGPMARHKDLVNDLNNLLPTAASLSGALAKSFAAFREHPLDTITALIAAPFNLSVTAEKRAYQFGVEHGREMIDSMVEPVDTTKKKPEAAPQQKPEGFLDRAAAFFGAAHDRLVQGAWTKMGEKIGYAVGWAVINAAMLIFSEGIGNAMVEGAAALAKFGETLGAFGKLITGMAEVLAGVGKAVAAVEKLINSAMGLLLKPFEKLLKPFLVPFGKFLQDLGAFLRKFLGFAEKEGATLATEAVAKGVSAATGPGAHAPTPAPHVAPHQAPAPHVAPHEAPVPAPAPHAAPASAALDAPVPKAGRAPAAQPHGEPVPARGPAPLVDEAKAASRAAIREKLPEGITDETVSMLEQNPELLEALASNPRAAAALTLCHSPCIPEFASAAQVARVERLLAAADRQGVKISQTELRNFLHTASSRAELTRAIQTVEKAVAKTPPGATAEYGTKFASDKEIQEALAPLNEPPGKKPQPNSDAPAVKIVQVEVKVETAVRDAQALLKKRGVKGLGPTDYGRELHIALEEVVRTNRAAPPGGWVVASEKRLGELVQLQPRNANMRVYDYLRENGLLERYPNLPRDYLHPTKSPVLSRIQPDLYVRAPSGEKMIWDLGSEFSEEHLAKTMLYAEIVAREEGGFIRIAESYWQGTGVAGPARPTQ
jgi:hypothetical protein